MKLDRKGFTLIEVLAVIAIIGILGMIAIPGVLSSIDNSKTASYDIMISNIIVASQSLYEEVENGGTLYDFNASGRTGTKLVITSNSITFNLQTLVSNGFLSGVNNDCSGACNRKILLEPKKNKNIGTCRVKVTKNTGGKYSVVGVSGGADCPSIYKKR